MNTPLLRRRIYVERNGTRGGCFTLTDIWETGKKPLYPVDPENNEREKCGTFAYRVAFMRRVGQYELPS